MQSLRLTLRSGLVAMLLLFALLMSVIGGGSYLAMKQARNAFDSVYALNVVQLGTARELYAALMQTRVLLDSYQTDYNRLRVKPAKKTWAQAQATFASAKQRLAEMPPAAPESPGGDLADRFRALIDDGIQPGFDTLKAWDVSAYQTSVKQANDLTAALDASLAGLSSTAKANAVSGAAAMERDVHLLQVGLTTAAVVTLALILLAFFMFQRHLLRPLGEVRRHCADIAQGDLSQRLSTRGVREMRSLKSGVDAMQASLLELVSQLQRESRALRGDALELTEASHALNDQSRQQAQALQQTTASMEEITATVAHTADHADQGRTLSEENRRRIDASGDQISTAVTEIEAAQARSESSLEVIGMIDSLTFQTNLLALNASVEAARAGAQGRGFAVVAAEVRGLSARSAEAAKTIRAQIEGTHLQVRKGAQVLTQARETMATAVQSGHQLGQLLEGIALSCQQQRDGIHQIDQAISAIDIATQRNVSLAERTLRATQDLDARAQRQQEHCNQFTLETPVPGPDAGMQETAEPDSMALADDRPRSSVRNHHEEHKALPV
ncbi:MAG: Tar ligand binding domain-containing protein [Salinicola sp.]|uniref:methyl-accepting chemotaxis protein n=1 Tax=Salinicola sp. TaxID=1978524 RepID=UPI001E0EAAEB|nr:methyl-accepting chemotaxis protein [Salinicola sp.]NRB54647.1 Tar ligand binding domain-containing protein [Salinicola sp.]